MKHQTLAVRLACLSTLSAGLFLTPALAADQEVLAKVGDSEMKADDIRSSVQALDPREQSAVSHDPNLLNQFVRSLLVRKVVLKEALAKHWDQQPSVITELERAHTATLTESYLQSVSEPPAGYPSDTEIQAAYDANKARLVVPKQYRLAQIYIAVAKTADKPTTEKAQTKLEAVRKSLTAKDNDFGAVAKSQSDDPQSAAKNGEIGWLTETQIQPEIRGKMVQLAKNSVSEPIQLEDGWHILKMLDVKESYTPGLDEVRTQISDQLRKEKTQANRQAYLQKLTQQNPVSINELALSKVLEKDKTPKQ